MNPGKLYYGVIVPLITPFTENGDIDYNSLKRILDYTISAGTFPFVLGTTGESMSMPVEQRIKLVQKTVEFVGNRKTLYAGISDNSVSNTFFLADKFKKWGVDVFVAHLPSYYPLKDIQIFNYFKNLADKCPCPLMIYNIPSTTHVSVSLEIVDELSAHPNICGLKDSERSMERMEILGERYTDRKDFSIVSGWTTRSLKALLSGFDGIVPNTANLTPALFTKLYKAVCEGDLDEANEIQNHIDIWANLYQKDRVLGDVFAALKVLMHDKELCKPHVLPPLSQLSDQEKTNLLKAKDIIKEYE